MKRGLALILVVGMLAVLAVLGTAFAILGRLERRASVQRALATRAKLLARSGVEDALARISSGQDPSSFWNQYRGEDWNDDGLVTGLESTAEVFQPGTSNLMTCPVKDAMAPSFFKRHATDLDSKNQKAPERIRVDGRERGWSGRLDGQTYALKVEDESAKINVNGGLLGPLANASGGWNDQLLRILDVLGDQPEVGIPTLGQLALQARPASGYPSVEALQKAVGFPDKDLSPWITVHSWTDRKVVRPNASWDLWACGAYGNQADLKLSLPPLQLEEGGRPPVNLNAAQRPVLVALLRDLCAICSAHEIESMQFEWTGQTYWSIPRDPGDPTADPLLAEKIADRILAGRPFADWPAFERFVDGLIPNPITGYGRDDPLMVKELHFGGNCCITDLIKANFDPNTKLVTQMPDQLMARWIDKSDLLTWSTEGSLGPTGCFRIASAGRVLSADGRLLASAGNSQRVEDFTLLRHTTQMDFVAGRSLWNSPALEPRYLSLAPVWSPTAGISASADFWGGPPPGFGLAAMTYPCHPAALPSRAASFDGYLGLSTVEEAALDPGTGTLKFLHHFDDGWDADFGNPATRDASLDGPLQTEVSESVWPDNGSRPNTLLPDGMHGHPGSTVAFDAFGNLPEDLSATPSDHGVLSYWAKTASEGDSKRADCSAIRRIPMGHTQTLATGGYSGLFGVIGETRLCVSDPLLPPPHTPVDENKGLERQNLAHQYGRIKFLRPGFRWHLVTALWDTDETVVQEDVFVWASSAQGAAATEASPNYLMSYNLLHNEVLREPGAVLTLGAMNGGLDTPPTVSNVVLDEFAIADFQDTVSGMLGSKMLASIWHGERFQRGRYYKGDDAFFRSPKVEPDPGRNILLLSARWTAYLPREKRKEYLCSLSGAGTGMFGVYYNPDVPTDRYVDPRLLKASVEVDLRAAADPDANRLQVLSQGALVNRSLPGFRYRVTFHSVPLDPLTGLEDPLNQPVLETPFLDDITFYYQKQGGPRFLAVERP